MEITNILHHQVDDMADKICLKLNVAKIQYMKINTNSDLKMKSINGHIIKDVENLKYLCSYIGIRIENI